MKGRLFWGCILISLFLNSALFLASCADQADQNRPESVAPTAIPATATAEPTKTAAPRATETSVEAEPSQVDKGAEEVPLAATAFENLHVPSPDWQDQIIYFVMTDRFADGDPANNDQGADEYDPSDFRKYNGGDLQGIIDKLDYIQELGATAVWITPPVSSQWWDPLVEFGGYHGYWAENFKEVDPHLGDLETYQALSDGLHARGMYLIQDIVTNHTGNFFTYRDEEGTSAYNPADPAAGVRFNTQSVPVAAPRLPPFDQNNVTDPSQAEAAIYHWTPTIEDFSDEGQRLTYQLSDLDDLNTANPVVREALRNAYGHWIEQVGVDGFRIDTAKYAEHEFWNDFIHSDDSATPGINAVAARTGRDDFLTFGEVFDSSEPYDDAGDRFVASYLGTERFPELAAVINFPMHFTINRVFAEGQPAAELIHRLDVAQDTSIYRDPYITPHFIDNHDVPRFLSRGNIAGLKQATMFLMTIPGIPVIYYGTEQGFSQTRAAMFAEGWESGGVDHFDEDSELFGHVKTLSEMRRSNPLFTRGILTTLAGNSAGPGVLSYRRDLDRDTALIIFNTSDRPVLMTDMDTRLPEGTILKLLYGLSNQDDLVVGRDGKLTLELAPREGMILLAGDEKADLESDQATIIIETNFAEQVYSEDFEIAGVVSRPGEEVKIIVNGNLASAREVLAGDDGRFVATMPISGFPPGPASNTVTAYAPELMVASATYSFDTEVTHTDSKVTVYDLNGDDVGPLHSYSYPTEDTFGQQMDIQSVTASAFGSNLVVDIEMAEVTDVWGPPNGFDHVLFHIFVDLPDSDGLTVLPHLNAEAPEGFAWDYMSFTEGWSNRLFSTDGADADTFGAPVAPVPVVNVDQENRIISFLLLSDALGNPETLEGSKVYVTAWDWNGVDAVYRPLRPQAGQWVFGGGDESAGDPLIIDDSDIIEITPDTRRSTFDPAGDDNGPYNPATASGIYTKPDNERFGQQMDLRRVTLVPTEDGLRVLLETGEVTNSLGAPNGFDGARFHVYFDLPDQEGATVLPFLNASAPANFDWEIAAIVDGWNRQVYSFEGAAADSNGSRLPVSLDLLVIEEDKTFELLLPAAALGDLEEMDQVKAYVATWDWDAESGALRSLTQEGGDFEFGGGDGAVDPLILDDVLVGQPSDYLSPIPPAPKAEITFLISVPEGTPLGDDLFVTGEFNNWNPADPDYRLTDNGDGTYSLILSLEGGSVMEFRITRGSFANAERLDPNDRFANRRFETPVDPTTETVEIEVEGWWDQ